MPSKPRVIRAWVALGSHNIYMKVGRHWFEKGYTYEDCPSSVRWMALHCLELHPTEAKKLNAARLKAAKGKKG